MDLKEDLPVAHKREYIDWKPKIRFKTSANLLSDRYGQTMLKLRKFLCWWFGFLTLVLLSVPIFSIFIFFKSSRFRDPSPGGGVLVFFFVFFFVFAAPFGMAWWTVKKKKAFARVWAILASIEQIFFSLLPLIVMNLPNVHQGHSPHYRSHHFGIFEGVLLAIGIAGLVCFSRRDSIHQVADKVSMPPRLAGDGTSRLLEGITWVLGFGGMIVGINWYLRWGHSHGLPITNGYLSLIQIVPAILIVTTLHEAGHAAVGRALGMKSRAFVVGPFQWRICDGQWRFQFLPVKFFSGGLTSQVPANSEFSRWKETWMIAGGPLASLLAGVVALSLTLTAAGKSYERFWEFFGLVATVSLGGFALNLIPGRSGVNYTDGAQIYQLLRGGSWAALHHLMNVADSMQVTTLRPKDFDIHAIQRLCLSFERGRQGFQLRLLASSYFLDSGMISQACDAVAEAERIYNESPWDTSAELCMAFVYRTAFLRHDATAARRWWDRMEAKKPTHFGVDYWLAKSALSWIEGHAGEAREAWEKGNLMAQKLPAAGDYEFDRYRCSLLRDCIEKMEPSLAS